MIPTPKKIDTITNYDPLKKREMLGLEYFPEVKKAMKDFKQIEKEIAKEKAMSNRSIKYVIGN